MNIKNIYSKVCMKVDVEDKTINIHKQRHIYLSVIPNLNNPKYTKSTKRFIITYFIPIIPGIKIFLI